MKSIAEVPADLTTNYPQEFSGVVAGRIKRRLGKTTGLRTFSVVLIELPPGVAASLRMQQSHEDYFYLALQGQATLVTDDGEEPMAIGAFAGFPAGGAVAHCIVNRTNESVVVLEVASFAEQNVTTYAGVDLRQVPSEAGGRAFVRRDGSRY